VSVGTGFQSFKNLRAAKFHVREISSTGIIRYPCGQNLYVFSGFGSHWAK